MATSALGVGNGLFGVTDALTRPFDEAAIDALERGATPVERSLAARETGSAIRSTIGSAFLIVLVVGTPALMGPLLAYLYDNVTPGTIALCAGLTLAAVGLVFTFATWRVRAVRNRWRMIGTWTHRWRLSSFAADNDIQYTARPLELPAVGSVLAAAVPQYIDTFALSLDGRTALIGNARPRATEVGGHAPDGWFFAAIKLDAAVPHMLLVPRAKGLAAKSVPLLNPAGTQRLGLEGDFDRHFTLYVPEGYERDALYVITPDLMALLIDELPGSYVEVYEDQLVVTSPRPLDFERPATWAELARLIAAVLPKTLRQTGRYRDERSGVRGLVAPQGRALKPGVSVASAVGVVLVIVQVLAFVLR